MIGLPIVFYVRYKKNERYDKRRRRLCFRHATQEAMAGADIDARHGEPDTVNDPDTWCAECKRERQEML